MACVSSKWLSDYPVFLVTHPPISGGLQHLDLLRSAGASGTSRHLWAFDLIRKIDDHHRWGSFWSKSFHGKPSNYMILYGYLWYIYIYIYTYIIYIYIYYLWYIDDGVVLTPSHIQNLVRAWRQRDRSTDATRRVYRLYHMWRSWLGQHKALGDKYNYLMSLNVYIYVYICVCDCACVLYCN